MERQRSLTNGKLEWKNNRDMIGETDRERHKKEHLLALVGDHQTMVTESLVD